MTRNEALDFFRENSRCIKSVQLNPIKKSEMYDKHEPIWIEHRIGNNGSTFILYDMGKHGWDLYFNDGFNNVDKSVELFKEKTFRKDEIIQSMTLSEKEEQEFQALQDNSDESYSR